MKRLVLLFLLPLVLFAQQPDPHQGVLFYDWAKRALGWADLGDGIAFVVNPATGAVTLEVQPGFLESRVASLEAVTAQLQNQVAQQTTQIAALEQRIATLEANQVPPPPGPSASLVGGPSGVVEVRDGWVDLFFPEGVTASRANAFKGLNSFDLGIVLKPRASLPVTPNDGQLVNHAGVLRASLGGQWRTLQVQ